MLSLSTATMPYALATPAQREQALRLVQVRLQRHFPDLPTPAFARALAELQPELLPGSPAALPYPDLTQLVQYLAGLPEQPLLDPPLYGPWALELAQYLLLTSEMAVRALQELAAQSAQRSGPALGALLRRTAGPCSLAERLVQAQPWGLPSSPRLFFGLPGGGPAPGSPVVERLLRRVAPGG